MEKLRNDVKSACFLHVFFCHISVIFENIDLKFCTHIYQPLLPNIFPLLPQLPNVRLKKYFKGEIFEKENKLWKILNIFRNF